MIKKFIEEKPKTFYAGITGLGLLSIFAIKIIQNQIKKNQWFNSIDNQSLSNLDEVTTKHHILQIDIDFKQKILKGSVTYNFKSKINKLKTVVLDVNNVIVNNVTQDKEKLQFSIKKGIFSNDLGDQLIINLNKPIQKDSEFQISLEFQTKKDLSDDEATALNWLEPSQTMSKEYPYLFTQCQAIFCRSMFPCQDSPSVKATFEAKLSVDRHLSAWCSGKLNKNTYNKGQNTSTFHFSQDIPIPSYLFSIVAGNLEQRSVSQRCSVITEPQFINECADELENMEQFITELENYTGVPYEWGEYKIVILPPSFPYGGMENPVLTFANPTIIVGDKSCQDLVIHEMAHSWSGNLVSCKNWENFWLNEGMTMFLENKINSILNGEEHYKVISKLQNDELKIDIDEYTGDLHKRYTPLVPILNHDNPDDAFSYVPYIKGCQFLTSMEAKVGQQNWQKFVKSYFTYFKNQSLDTKQFLEFFKQFLIKTFSEQKAEIIWDSIDFQSWLHQPGYPPQCSDLNLNKPVEIIEKSENLALEFLKDSQIFINQPETIQLYNSFKMELKVLFFNKLYENKDKITKKIVEDLDNSLKLMESEKNPEILFKFILIGINFDYQPVYQHLPVFLSTIGRMKFCRPIYKELFKNGKKELAHKIYLENVNFYHSIAAKMIAKDIGI